MRHVAPVRMSFLLHVCVRMPLSQFARFRTRITAHKHAAVTHTHQFEWHKQHVLIKQAKQHAVRDVEHAIGQLQALVTSKWGKRA